MKRALLVAASTLFLAATGFADKPARNINADRHQNLASAQRLCQQAWEKISAAQRANEWDMNGHAKRAKELLEQVNDELKQAALAANADGR
jgi:hypothetical protein